MAVDVVVVAVVVVGVVDVVVVVVVVEVVGMVLVKRYCLATNFSGNSIRKTLCQNGKGFNWVYEVDSTSDIVFMAHL